jgi:hypothetical protein
MKRLSVYLCLTFSVVAFLRCTSMVAGGAGGETSNGIVAVIYDNQGNPAAGASVSLRRADYYAPIPLGKSLVKQIETIGSFDGTLDAAGRLVIESVEPGAYILEVNTGSGYAVALNCTVSRDDSLTDLGSDTLEKTGSLTGTIPTGMNVRYVQVRGLDRSVAVDNQSRSFTVDNLPAGVFTLRLISTDTLVSTVLDSVVVRAAESVVLPVYSAWGHSMKIGLNTSVSGAGVAGNVLAFPVLVRLTMLDFDFSQAQQNGADLRFSKADSTPLPFTIERWDAAQGKAEVWVKVDTVHGNNSTQQIVMYWGNAMASGVADSASVFDTAQGFAGVWHLAESSGAALDATANKYDGTFQGTLSRAINCAIGLGQSLYGSVDYVEMGDVLNATNRNLSISAWVKRASLGTQSILAKTNGSEPNDAYGYQLTFDSLDVLHFAAANAGSIWGDSGSVRIFANRKITDFTTWHYVCAVIDRASLAGCRIYIDGVDMTGNVEGDIATVGILSNNLPFRIGSEADDQFKFHGELDEVAESFDLRSADWVKLCYMNQKPDQSLVVFQK